MSEVYCQAAEGYVEPLKDPFKLRLKNHHDDEFFDDILICDDKGKIAIHCDISIRYKTSGLSGDEWRINSYFQIIDGKYDSQKYFDGRLPEGDKRILFEQTFHNMSAFLQYFPYFAWKHIPKKYWDLSGGKIILRKKGIVVLEKNVPTFGEAAFGVNWNVCLGTENLEYKPLTNEQNFQFCQQPGCKEKPKTFYQMKKICISNSGHTEEPQYTWSPKHTWFCKKHETRGDCGIEDADDNYIKLDMKEGWHV